MQEDEGMGKRIKSLRSSFKLTQGDVAEVCEVSTATVSQWETGIMQPKAIHAVRLADFFRVSVHFLVMGSAVSVNSTVGISPDEALHLKKWAKASVKTRKIIDLLLD